MGDTPGYKRSFLESVKVNGSLKDHIIRINRRNDRLKNFVNSLLSDEFVDPITKECCCQKAAKKMLDKLK